MTAEPVAPTTDLLADARSIFTGRSDMSRIGQDLIREVERLHALPLCTICGGRVDLSVAVKPTVRIKA